MNMSMSRRPNAIACAARAALRSPMLRRVSLSSFTSLRCGNFSTRLRPLGSSEADACTATTSSQTKRMEVWRTSSLNRAPLPSFASSNGYCLAKDEFRRRCFSSNDGNTNHNDKNASVSLPQLLSQAEWCKEQHDWEQAEALFRRALDELLSNENASFSQDALDVLIELGDTLWCQGKLHDAEALYQEGLLKLTSSEKKWRHTCQTELAMLWMHWGRLDEAEPLLRRVLDEQLDAESASSMDTLETMNHLGSLLLERCREAVDVSNDAAENDDAVEKALAEQAKDMDDDSKDEEEDDDDDDEVGKRNQQYLKEAEPLLRQSLDGLQTLWNKRRQQQQQSQQQQSDNSSGTPSSSTKAFSNNKPHRLDENLWTARNNWAMFLWNSGKEAEATEYMEETLQGLRDSLGDDHPATLSSMDNLASFWVQLSVATSSSSSDDSSASSTTSSSENSDDKTRKKDISPLERAKPLLHEALDGKRRVLGERHPSTLSTLNNYGSIFMAQEQYHAAEPYLQLALKGLTRSYGQVHPDTLLSLVNLAALYRTTGQFDQAADMLEQRYNNLSRHTGPHATETLSALHDLALCCQDYLQDYDRAQALLKEELVGWQAVGNAKRAAEAKTALKNAFQMQQRQRENNEKKKAKAKQQQQNGEAK